MKVLMVSKFRGLLGGVEGHLEFLCRKLGEGGHEVAVVSSEDLPGQVFDAGNMGLLGSVRNARRLMWNSSARRVVASRIKSFDPDVIHYHSVYHQLSHSVLSVGRGVPKVMTVHDFKIAAPCYSLVRDGAVCDSCVGRRFPVDAVRHRCVKGSLPGSALCCVEHLLFHGVYRSSMNRFVVPSQYAKAVMIRAGLEAEKIDVVRWAADVGWPQPEGKGKEPGGSPPVVLYIGRLERTKGVDVLMEAWRALSVRGDYLLRLLGDGAARREMEDASRTLGNVEVCGRVGRDRVITELSRASLVVVPSRGPETFSLSVLEALRMGVPVLSSGRGALREFEGPGYVEVEGHGSTAWRVALEKVLVPGRLAELHCELRARDFSEYGEDRFVAAIERVYETAIGQKRSQREK